MAQADRDFVVRAARWGIVAAITAAVLFGLLFVLKAALTPLAAAFVLAYLFDPVIDHFERNRVKRGLAIGILIAVIGGGTAVLALFLLPRIALEARALAQKLPGYIERVQTEFLPWVEGKLGVELPGTFTELVAEVRSGDLPLHLTTISDFAANVISSLTGTVTGTVASLVGLLVIPILAYYLLVEFDDLLARLARWVPPRNRDYVIGKARQVDRLISAFLRGQITIGIILGVLYAVGFSVIGIDLAVGVGLLSGILALVPYLGNAVALVSASGLALLGFGFDWHLFAVIGWYVVVQNLEGFVLTPRIVGSSVGLHPAVVIIALLIGGDLFGFLGLLIAVPAAAVLKVFLGEALAIYRESSWFEEPSAEA